MGRTRRNGSASSAIGNEERFTSGIFRALHAVQNLRRSATAKRLMILVDTSVWIAHFRKQQPALADLLCDGRVVVHPFVTGELACGNLSKRAAVLADLAALPAATSASDTEVMRFIEDRRLWGRGLGWIDAHLLASALLSRCRLWTLDQRLGAAASELGVS